ncbi:cag pathogenicity island protein (plasmid) [Campylobacter fetus]|uniref:Cag pathogenicity island protein n=1 Tax=Campylobacter fetus TaxID=196 RepID=A0A974MV79_CAMFE|nr:cag pathogenicity island Cag12 family protein [Campylobacter fetus]OCS32895.1 hypothetical protein AWR31_08120 [Campylobacter fetus subsp. venerealis]QMS59897.1 cag pathogenicity island protein [Campylobacter fetus]
MKAKSFLGILSTSLILVGCSTKPPEPVKLDGGSAITINQSLLTLKEKGVGKDKFLTSNKWTYNMFFTKNEDGLIKNDEIVKAFYLAHNSEKIIIVGYENMALEYKNYFLNNQVTADIEIHPVDSIDLSKNKVNVLFFSKNHLQGVQK